MLEIDHPLRQDSREILFCFSMNLNILLTLLFINFHIKILFRLLIFLIHTYYIFFSSKYHSNRTDIHKYRFFYYIYTRWIKLYENVYFNVIVTIFILVLFWIGSLKVYLLLDNISFSNFMFIFIIKTIIHWSS